MFRLFALHGSRALGEGISRTLDCPLSEHEERDFSDGEHKIRPLESVRECDVYVVHSLYGETDRSVNDKLNRLLFFIGALKDAAARHVTAVVPYLCYARKDRQTKPRDPVTTRYVAALFEAVGTDRVVTMDVHNLAAFQNAFRCRTEHVLARSLFVDHFADRLRAHDAEPVVLSPDAGGVKQAEQFREALSDALGTELPLAFMEKKRSEGKISGRTLVGDVADRSVVILDDLISTGTTLVRSAEACRAAGATAVYAAATHGVFVEDANDKLDTPALDQIAITDTIAPPRLDDALIDRKLVVLDAAPLLARAIARMHRA